MEAIVTLDLSGKGLTALEAHDLARLTSLQELYLQNNALATLPGTLLDEVEARGVAGDLKGNPGYLESSPFDFCRDSDGTPLAGE